MVTKINNNLNSKKNGKLIKKYPRRQTIRKSITFISFLLFPAIFYYLSPYLIIDSSLAGVIGGSFIVFGAMLVSAIFLGRAYCGWLCPAGGVQDIVMYIKKKDRKIKINTSWIKWVVFIPWIILILIIPFITPGYEFQGFNFFWKTEESFGLSLTRPGDYIIYYGVILIILLMTFLIGRRSFCHHLCWMAPFMVIGRWIGNLIRVPALRLEADSNLCIECHRCERECLMSLPVEKMVKQEQMEHRECILCGNCIDACPKNAISYSFRSFKKGEKY